MEEYSLPSNWSTFVCTQANLKLVWEKLNLFPILFDDSVRGDYEWFLKEMFDSDSIILLAGDYGICRISNIIPHRECEVHLVFWDRRFKGRLEECRLGLKWLFLTLDLVRASISIPSIAHSTITFTKAMGFKKEGIRRVSWRVNGKYLDTIEFGILRDEVFSELFSEPVLDLKEVEPNGKQEEINE
jgi:hypothetical protein